jgi:hypothetical protein
LAIVILNLLSRKESNHGKIQKKRNKQFRLLMVVPIFGGSHNLEEFAITDEKVILYSKP